MGSQQNKAHDQSSSPKKPKEAMPTPEETLKTIYGCSLYQRAEKESVKSMQQAWGTSVHKRRQDHQNPPGGSQG